LPEATSEAPGKSRPRPAVLVVEDDEDSLLYVKAVLGGAFRIFPAASVGEARRLLAEHEGEIQLVLADVYLGAVESGLDVARHARRSRGPTDLPVVAISALDRVGLSQLAHEAGCNAFLAKPSSPRELFSLVERLVGRRTIRAA
jgi:two-component system cell cycle response regulator DivK